VIHSRCLKILQSQHRKPSNKAEAAGLVLERDLLISGGLRFGFGLLDLHL